MIIKLIETAFSYSLFTTTKDKCFVCSALRSSGLCFLYLIGIIEAFSPSFLMKSVLEVKFAFLLRGLIFKPNALGSSKEAKITSSEMDMIEKRFNSTPIQTTTMSLTCNGYFSTSTKENPDPIWTLKWTSFTQNNEICPFLA